MFIGHVSFAARAVGLTTIEEYAVQALGPSVSEATLTSNQDELTIEIVTAPLASKADARTVAEREAERLWRGIAISKARMLALLERPRWQTSKFTDEHGKELAVELGVPAATLSITGGEIQVLVGGEGPMTEFERALVAPLVPHVQRAWELYETALQVRDEVAQFLAMYAALLVLFPSEEQKDVDAFVEKRQGGRTGWPRGKNPRARCPYYESPYTRIRNRFMHPDPTDSADRWDSVSADARAQLRSLRDLVAFAILNPPPI